MTKEELLREFISKVWNNQRKDLVEKHFAITWILTGTNLGKIGNYPSTNKKMKTNGMTIYYFNNKLISGHSQIFDRITVMKQLGFK